MEQNPQIYFLVIVIAYFFGSISSAIIVCKMMGYPDPRTQGSKNPGATNVLRIAGKKPAALVLLGDSLKGLIPILICHWFNVPLMIMALVGAAAFLGHLYPLFFKFKGGKGVATAIGIQLGIHWMLGLFVIAIWLFFAKVVKISSLAALISMALAPLAIWFIVPNPYLLIMQIFITILLFWRHRSNIQQLISGSETKIGH